MKAITFECETITPMFLGGADGRTPELRPPSIKGLMRFWWRAMNGHLSLEELKEREAKIFGTSDEKVGRSRFKLRINKQPSSDDIINSLWEETPHEERTSGRGKKYKIPIQYKGMSYLLYSTHMLNDRPYIKTNTSFSIGITSSDGKALQEAVYSFAFLTFFGALGTRNRRGAGAFAVKDVIYDGDDDYKKLFCSREVQSPEDLNNFIEYKLKTLLVSTNNRSYSILKNSKVYILNPKSDWQDALEAIGQPFLDFRDKNKRRIEETPNFGFPILHRNPKRLMGAGPKKSTKNRNGNVVDFIERRASPLIFKVVKANKDNYFPVIIWLYGELVPSNYEIKDKKGGIVKEPDEGIIIEFLKTVKGKMEVIL